MNFMKNGDGSNLKFEILGGLLTNGQNFNIEILGSFLEKISMIMQQNASSTSQTTNLLPHFFKKV